MMAENAASAKVEANHKPTQNPSNVPNIGLNQVASKATISGSRSPVKRDTQHSLANSRDKKTSSKVDREDKIKVAAVKNEKVAPLQYTLDS